MPAIVRFSGRSSPEKGCAIPGPTVLAGRGDSIIPHPLQRRRPGSGASIFPDRAVREGGREANNATRTPELAEARVAWKGRTGEGRAKPTGRSARADHLLRGQG